MCEYWAQDWMHVSTTYLLPVMLIVCWLQATEWAVDETTRRSCQSKGKTEVRRERWTLGWKICEWMSVCYRVYVWNEIFLLFLCSSQDECQNYVRVLLLNGSRLFTCGTNAFMPICTTRPITDMASVLESISGVARCPYDPRHNSTAMITESGEVYAATVTDFSSRDPIIYRSLGNMPPLRTAQYNSKWLSGTVGRHTHLSENLTKPVKNTSIPKSKFLYT